MARKWLKIVNNLGRRLHNLVHDRRANVLMIVGLAAPVIFGAAGFAVDYGYASYVKRSLDQAADASALAATSQSAAASGGGYANVTWLRQFGVNTFNGDIAKLNVSVTPTVTVVPNASGGVVATTSYTYTVPTYFSSLLGIPSIAIAGSATATANPITYIDYYILLDISQSMGIGATADDMANLFARTQSNGNGGCVFGCHVPQAGQAQSNEYLAHNISPRINLRLDAAVSAIQNIIADAKAAAGVYKNIRIGVYTMSKDPTTGQVMTVVSSPTSDYDGLTTKVGTIDLGNNTAGGIGDTDYVTSGGQFFNQVPANGTGLLATSPKNYMFLIADGVNDTPGSCTSGHCTSVFDPSSCTYLQAKATVGTIYTTYLPIYNNNDSKQGYQINYQQLVLPFASQIAPNMKSCASSSGYYYEASDGPALNAAMKSLFASTLQTARLTQ